MKATRLDYLLSTGVCIASDELNVEGDTFDVPIDDSQVVKVWNVPRGDKNAYDGSGPAKLRLTLLVDDVASPYAVPVQMESYVNKNTYYRKLVGAEAF